MDIEARNLNKNIRRDGKKYFKVSQNDLRAMKKASGRPQDLADIKLIEEARKYKKRLFLNRVKQ